VLVISHLIWTRAELDTTMLAVLGNSLREKIAHLLMSDGEPGQIGATALCGVAHIVLLCAPLQVGRVHARRIIALMAGYCGWKRTRPFSQLQRNVSGKNVLSGNS
jgi:hypothetical protein